MADADPRDDFDALVAWQDGDRDARDALISRHFWPIYRFFRSNTDDAAEDLTQRTFLGCPDKRDRIKAELGFRAYRFGRVRGDGRAGARAPRSRPRAWDQSQPAAKQL